MRRLTMIAGLCGVVALSGCAPKMNMKLLINMLDAQETFFRKELVAGFTNRSRPDIEVVRYGSVDSIPQELSKVAGQAGLVKVPFDKAPGLVGKNKVLPLNSFLTPKEIDEFTDTYLLTSLGKYGRDYNYVPRKFESRILVYSRSKVADAYEVWRSHRDSVSKALEKLNGYGLPATYLLEEDPNEWDYFDVLVVGWIWAHMTYDGKTVPRVAHRGRRYSGTSLRVIDRVFQCSGDSNAVLSIQGEAVVDAFHWEAIYAALGVYNPRMWEEEWSGMGVWEGVRDGEVFLAFMTQIDCFFLHGTGRDGLEGYFADPSDMGVALMPTGCSAELNKTGMPKREGTKAITTGGWWWGIPRDSPDPRASYELARHITSTANQIQECSRFGMIPVRKDILSEMSMMFGGGWITEIYETSFKQLMHNKHTTIPGNINFARIGEIYLDAWYDIVVGKNWSAAGFHPQRDYIARVLKRYARKAEAILASTR